MQTEVKWKRKLALSTKRKASEEISADSTKKSALEPRNYLFQAFLEPRQRLYACLVANPQQTKKHLYWPQSKLSLPAVDNSSVSNCVELKWTALPRPNTKHLTRQSVVVDGPLEGGDTLPKSPCLLMGDKSSDEEDPFAKFDELCASVDLTVYSNSSSEKKSPVISIGSVACSNGGSLLPTYNPSGPMSNIAPDHRGALCPVCGDLLVSKASLAEHMRTCFDIIELD